MRIKSLIVFSVISAAFILGALSNRILSEGISTIGKVTVKDVPLPTLLSTEMIPSCASIILLLISKPKPVRKDSDSNAAKKKSQESVPLEKTPVVIRTENKSLSEPRPGRVMCPECKKVFSGKTNYCPYDGEKLE